MHTYIHTYIHTQYEEYAESVTDWHIGLKGWSASEALTLLQSRSRRARLAAKNGDLNALKRVPIDLRTVRDNRKRTLLHVAAMHDQLEVCVHVCMRVSIIDNRT